MEEECHDSRSFSNNIIPHEKEKTTSLTSAAVTPEPFNELGELGYERISAPFLVVGIMGGYGTGRLVWRAQSGIVVTGQSRDEGDDDEAECSHRREGDCREEGDLEAFYHIILGSTASVHTSYGMVDVHIRNLVLLSDLEGVSDSDVDNQESTSPAKS